MLLVAQLLTAALFGSMLFFSCVMAPLVFTQLEEATAGRFIRAVFPWYYALLGGLSFLAAVMAFFGRPLEAGILLGISSLALFARQVLMPMINELRDRALGGDADADSQFNQMHRLSVIINLVQLIAVTFVLVLLLRS